MTRRLSVPFGLTLLARHEAIERRLKKK